MDFLKKLFLYIEIDTGRRTGRVWEIHKDVNRYSVTLSSVVEVVDYSQ